MTRILNRERWTTLSLTGQREIDQVGLEIESLAGNSIFLAASRFGTLRRPYLSTNYRLEFQREIFKGFLLSAGLRTSQFDPLYDFFYLEKIQGVQIRISYHRSQGRGKIWSR